MYATPKLAPASTALRPGGDPDEAVEILGGAGPVTYSLRTPKPYGIATDAAGDLYVGDAGNFASSAPKQLAL